MVKYPVAAYDMHDPPEPRWMKLGEVAPGDAALVCTKPHMRDAMPQPRIQPGMDADARQPPGSGK
jgi:hypothetical protein